MGISGRSGPGRGGACVRRHDRGSVAGPARIWLRMQRGELFALMTCGMAGVAGTVMIIYASRSLRRCMSPTHWATILVASIISTPAGLCARCPDGAVPSVRCGQKAHAVFIDDPPSEQRWTPWWQRHNGRACRSSPRIIAVLLVTVALVTLANTALGLLPDMQDGATVTLQRLFAGVPFRPVMWLIGVPWAESRNSRLNADGDKDRAQRVRRVSWAGGAAGGRVGAEIKADPDFFPLRFANFGSLGILIGGLGAMVPGRRAEVVGWGCARSCRARSRRA